MKKILIGILLILFASSAQAENQIGGVVTGTGRSGSLIVVAADASEWFRKNGDYFCDGTADEVQINAAITALPDTTNGTVNVGRADYSLPEPYWGYAKNQGGKVLLSDGSFILNGTITITDKSDVCLQGQGTSTVLYNAQTDSSDAIKYVNDDSGIYCRVIIRDLLIEGNSASGDGIYLAGVNYREVHNVHAQNNGKSGIHFAGHLTGNEDVENNLISNCQLQRNGYYGIYLYNTHETLISNSMIEYNDIAGFYLNDCVTALISNCGIEDNDTLGGATQILIEADSTNSGWHQISNNNIEGSIEFLMSATHAPSGVQITGNNILGYISNIGREEGDKNLESLVISDNVFTRTGSNNDYSVNLTRTANAVVSNNVFGSTLFGPAVGISIDLSYGSVVTGNTGWTTSPFYYTGNHNCAGDAIVNNNVIKVESDSRDWPFGVYVRHPGGAGRVRVYNNVFSRYNTTDMLYGILVNTGTTAVSVECKNNDISGATTAYRDSTGFAFVDNGLNIKTISALSDTTGFPKNKNTIFMFSGCDTLYTYTTAYTIKHIP